MQLVSCHISLFTHILNLIVLHPGLKLEYFRQQEWDEGWISNAEDLVREEYIINYQGKDPKATVPNAVDYEYLTYAIHTLTITSQDDGDNSNNDAITAFTNISITKVVASWRSELDKYLHKAVENVKDPLKWWIANQHVYPNLYHMALDFLSIPGMLVFI